MKNMKKILAVGALLTLGTMAMGVTLSSEAEFGIDLRVINPISIENIDDVDFGDLTKTQMTATDNIAEGSFQVTGDDKYSFKFTVATTKALTNQASSGETIDFTATVLDNGSGVIPNDQMVSTVGGIYNGKLQIALESVQDAVSGVYDGKVKVEVEYN